MRLPRRRHAGMLHFFEKHKGVGVEQVVGGEFSKHYFWRAMHELRNSTLAVDLYEKCVVGAQRCVSFNRVNIGFAMTLFVAVK